MTKTTIFQFYGDFFPKFRVKLEHMDPDPATKFNSDPYQQPW